jgi:hypothetical protein
LSFTAVIFDSVYNTIQLHRTFGGSLPICASSNQTVIRNHINPWNHVDDIKTTVNWVKAGNVDFADIER